MFRISTVFVIVGIIITDVCVLADMPAPRYSYKQLTSDRQFLFVMLSPSAQSDMGAASMLRDLSSSDLREIRKTFTRSGLYRNDGSSSPIWTVDWYAKGAQPLSDGIHLVRPGQWAGSYGSEAVAFFANSKLIRSYSVSELVANPKDMPHTISHFTWRAYEKLNEQYKRYTIVTKEKKHYVFDVTTGEVIFSGVAPGETLPSGVAIDLALSATSFGAYSSSEVPVVNTISVANYRWILDALLSLGIIVLGWLLWRRYIKHA